MLTGKETRLNNKGFSFVEVILVICIIAILALGATFGLAYSQGRDAEKASQEIISVLREAESLAMAKYETKVTITYDADGDVVTILSTKDTKDSEANLVITKICDKTVSITCNAKGPGDDMVFIMDRTNGGFKSCPDNEIYIEKGNNKTIISITPVTGKISIE